MMPIGQVLPTNVRSPSKHNGEEGRDSGQGQKVDIFNCDEEGWTGRETSRQKVIGSTAAHTYRQILWCISISPRIY
ncbi:hypothetical protein MAR_032756, partial [Mya arenaria]